MFKKISERLRVMITVGAVVGMIVGPNTISIAGEIDSRTPAIDTVPIIEVGQDQAISPQRALTGAGKSAGAAAGQTSRGGSGFFSTTVLLAAVAAAATVAVALKATGDNDSISTTTTTN